MAVDLAQRTVLLVEDNPSVRRLVRAMLVNLGVGKVVECEGHVAALEHVARDLPDVVITLFQSPTVDGLAMTLRLRHPSLSAWPEIPVIALCSAPSKDLVLKARECGVSALLAKPLSHALLKGKLDQLLQGLPLARERRRAMGPSPGSRPDDAETVFL